MSYAVVIVPLSEEDGGGFAGIVPDLPGCKGDGDTLGEAAADTQNAILEWLDEAKRLGRDIPEAGTAAQRYIDERKTLVKVIEVLASDNESLEGTVSALNDLVKQIVHEYDLRDSPQSRMSLLGNAALASIAKGRSRH